MAIWRFLRRFVKKIRICNWNPITKISPSFSQSLNEKNPASQRFHDFFHLQKNSQIIQLINPVSHLWQFDVFYDALSRKYLQSESDNKDQSRFCYRL